MKNTHILFMRILKSERDQAEKEESKKETSATEFIFGATVEEENTSSLSEEILQWCVKNSFGLDPK